MSAAASPCRSAPGRSEADVLVQLLADPAPPVVQLVGGGLMLLNAGAAAWLIARPLLRGRGRAADREGTTA